MTAITDIIDCYQKSFLIENSLFKIADKEKDRLILTTINMHFDCHHRGFFIIKIFLTDSYPNSTALDKFLFNNLKSGYILCSELQKISSLAYYYLLVP